MKNLVCVKSIMTILLTAMLCVMVYLRPDDYGDVFKNIVVMVATFYFSYQANKVRNEIDNVTGSNSDGGSDSASAEPSRLGVIDDDSTRH